MDTAVGRWLGEDATGARLAVVAPRDTPEGYAGTLAALFTELMEMLVLGNVGIKRGPELLRSAK